MAFTPEDQIDDTPVTVEMEQSFLAYSMSVIVARALPDVRDGLKPVHRRILYSMHDLGLRPDVPYVKSGRVVGDVMGRFHPHGDAAIYATLVRMAQDFSMGLQLVDGHGNFGTHSDPAAAARYTEARMSKAAAAMVHGIDENTVDMKPNYDGKLDEPRVLPAGFPNLLVNGSEGIAVGMATKMPPHSLAEAVAACRHLLAHPDATVEDLIALMPAPDFPTGGLILDVGGAQEAARTGRGSFRIRARTEIVGRDIIITELPYQVGPETVIEAVKKMRDAGKLDEVASVIDLSDRNHGMRLVVTAKRTARGIPVNPAALAKKLFKATPLEISFAVHNLALVDGAPRTLNLLEMVRYYVDHRIEVTRRRSEFRRDKALARAHLLEGYLIALDAIDEVIAIIRGSRDNDSARKKLMKQFKLTEIQATSILEMQLRRLTGLEVQKITTELKELRKLIAELERVLNDAGAMRELVSNDLQEQSAPFSAPRRTVLADISAEADDDAEAEAVPDTPTRLVLTTTGKLGRFSPEPHKGARGKDDAVAAWVDCSVRDTIGAITNTGRLLHLHPIDVPVCEARAKGGKVEEFIADLESGERVVGLVRIADDAPMIAMATRNGFVKRFKMSDAHKKSGMEICGFKGDDEVVAVTTLVKNDPDVGHLVLVTSAGQLLKFPTASVRPQGRTGAGVAGIRLSEGARVVALGAVGIDEPADVVVVTDAKHVKHTPLSDYPEKGRGGAGVRCVKMLRTDTEVVAAAVAPLSDVTGVGPGGGMVKLPADAAKRDASGVPGDSVTLAWARP